MQNYIGEKGRARTMGNQKAKEFFKTHNIATCEANFEGCWHSGDLFNAHDRKGKNLSIEDLAEPDMARQILCCNPCHHILEHEMSEEEMGNFIRKVATERNERIMETQVYSFDEPMAKEKPKEKPKKKKANICPKCGWGTGHAMICTHCGERVT